MLFFAIALLGVCFPLYFLRKFRQEHQQHDGGGSGARTRSLAVPLLVKYVCC